MWKRKVFFIAYLLTVLSINRYVEGTPRPVEYLSQVKNAVIKRLRRSALNFHRAVICYQPSIIVLGTYGDYGCYCGVNGNENYEAKALDETDACCKRHDECYDEAGNVEKTVWESFWMNQHLLQGYTNYCLDGEVVCAKNSPYQDKLCNCDKDAAKCFYEASTRYRPQLFNVNVDVYCKADSKLEGLNLTYYENRQKVMEDNLPQSTKATISDNKDTFNVAKEQKQDEEQFLQLTTGKPVSVVHLQTNITTVVTGFADHEKQKDSVEVGESHEKSREGEEKKKEPTPVPNFTSTLTSAKLEEKKGNSDEFSLPMKRPPLRPVVETGKLLPVVDKESAGRLRQHAKSIDEKSARRALPHTSTPSRSASVFKLELPLAASALIYVVWWNSFVM